MRTVARVALVVLGLLLLAELALVGVAPARDPTPLPWRNPRLIPWGTEVKPGVHRTVRGQLVDLAPPPTRFRVAVVGSSAVAGSGVTLYHAFPWRLQRGLEARGLDAEVLNLGLPGQDSAHDLVAVQRALQELRPDLVVVYSGNNEFHRLRAYKARHPRWSAGAERVRQLLDQWALYRALTALRGPTAAPSTEEQPLHEIDAQVTAEDRRLAAEQFRANLEAMVGACRVADTPLVLCTVAGNDDSEPNYGRPDDVARPHLERGRAARDRGDLATARREMDRARELDPAPNRMLPSLNAVVRGVAGVPVVDVEEGLRRDRPLLQRETFLDNCHFTQEGHERVAALLEAALPLPAGGAAETADPGGVESLDVEGWLPASPHVAPDRHPERIPEPYRPWLDVLMGGADPESALPALRRPGLERELHRAAILAGRYDLAVQAGRAFLDRGGRDPVVARDTGLLQR